MRILGLSKKWDKLEQPEFTTFRLLRRDKDWQVGEAVQVVYHPRSPNREPLGIAVITAKESMWFEDLTEQEAIADGFPTGKAEMWAWLLKAHGLRVQYSRLNKLSLKWVKMPQ